MPSAADLDRLRPSGLVWPGARCLSHGVGQSLEIVAGGSGCRRVGCESHDLPAAWSGETLGVRLTQVVAVGLGKGRQRPQNRSLVSVDIGQRRDRRAHAGRARATSDWTHEETLSSRRRSRRHWAPKVAPCLFPRRCSRLRNHAEGAAPGTFVAAACAGRRRCPGRCPRVEWRTRGRRPTDSTPWC